jgi:hypothetical protein
MAPSETRRISELLRALADAVEQSPSMLKEFLEDFSERFPAARPASIREQKIGRTDAEKRKAEEIIVVLQSSKTRDEARSRLQKYKLSRRELVEVARSRSVHITKDDSLSRIEEKLVEAVLGSRLNSEAIRGTRNEDPRFTELNKRIIQKTNETILREIESYRFKFVFNPEVGLSKPLTFKSDDQIGEGRNDNENSWRVNNGRLEILDSFGEVYSRFLVLRDGRFQHTNDSDTRSIKGQYIEPIEGF